MNKWYPILLSTLLVGCAETQVISTAATIEHQSVVQVADINWTPLTAPTSFGFLINDSSQKLVDLKSVGAVAAFEIPSNRGSLDIQLSTLVENNKTLYAANISVFGSNNELLVAKSFNEFEYKHSKYLDPDMFVLNFNIIPDGSEKPLKVLIYTTAQDLQSESQVTHPAKLFAIAKSTQPPEIPDPTIEHSMSGSFRLDIKVNDIVTRRVKQDQEYVPSKVDSTSFYLDAINSAVEDGNIPKALSLLDEAKALNIKDAQAVFVKAVNEQSAQ